MKEDTPCLERRPRLFVASSSEGEKVARAIQVALDKDCEVEVWNQGVFRVSNNTLDSLIEAISDFDFAVIVLTPDDALESRGELQAAPRDNVLFELGLFIGGIGKGRTFLVFDRDSGIKIPSDLLGTTAATYQQHSSGNLVSALGAACSTISEAISDLGKKEPRISGALEKVLGATNWAQSKTIEDSVTTHLRETHSTMKFMGFGFSNYLSIEKKRRGVDLKTTIERCLDVNNQGTPVRILMMNPFSDRILEYSNEKESPGRHAVVRKRMVENLRELEELTDSGYPISVRFYPDSLLARASFRMYIANDEKIFVSYYKAKYVSQDPPEVPEIELSRHDAEDSFFLAFHSLYSYLWENGEDASYRTLYHELSTSTLNGKELGRALENIESCRGDDSLDRERCVVAAVAGKDSMAAIVLEVESNPNTTIIPLIVKIPTETDPVSYRLKTLASLRRKLAEMGNSGRISPAIILTDDSEIWKRTNSGFDQALNGSLPSPCAGCHFYIHSIRCLVASKLGIKRVISGDRERHGTTIKFNQLGSVLNLFIEFSKREYGVVLDFPLRNVAADSEVWNVLQGIQKETVQDLSCVFSGQGSFSSVNEDREQQILRYVREDVTTGYRSAMESQ